MTYDLRHQQDSINPWTHADIMLLSHEVPNEEVIAHPYWYGRVIRIFMTMLSTMAQSQCRLISSELISFGFDGLILMFHFMVDGKPYGCIMLDF